MVEQAPVGRAARRRVLVVEDDRGIADAVARRLASEGYDVDTVHEGPAAVAAVLGPDGNGGGGGAAGRRYDAVVLDVMLPGLDGLEVCWRIQAQVPVPVLMLTARAEEPDRLVGLAVGADDYLAKPFSPRELVARVAALLRRVDRAAQLVMAGEAPPGGLRAGGLRLDPATRRAFVTGTEVRLTRTEFDLLACLAARPGAVLPRGRLIADVWQWDGAVPPSATRMLDSHVKALRRKIGAERIRTAHGVGYALEECP
ncbi:MAG: response regulator transcription factor [Actinomycetales bacterium]